MIRSLIWGAVLGVGVAAVIEGLLIYGRMQLFLTYAEQLLTACGVRIAKMPSKSAPRTDGSGEQPRRWYQRLRLLDRFMEQEPNREVPDTNPAGQLITPEAITGEPVVGDPVDQALARFTFAEGHNR